MFKIVKTVSVIVINETSIKLIVRSVSSWMNTSKAGPIIS